MTIPSLSLVHRADDLAQPGLGLLLQSDSTEIGPPAPAESMKFIPAQFAKSAQYPTPNRTEPIGDTSMTLCCGGDGWQ
jgi:hypothetical protein